MTALFPFQELIFLLSNAQPGKAASCTVVISWCDYTAWKGHAETSLPTPLRLDDASFRFIVRGHHTTHSIPGPCHDLPRSSTSKFPWLSAGSLVQLWFEKRLLKGQAFDMDGWLSRLGIWYPGRNKVGVMLSFPGIVFFGDEG